MNKFLKQLKKEAERIALTREEKERGRAILRAFMDTHPTAAGAAITAARHAVRLSLGARFAANTAVSLLVAALAGGGVALGAERALPGDMLYPIKISINEKIVGALKSAEAGVGWEASLAERRLKEAEELAARGKLDERTKAVLAVRFDAHVDRAVAGADALRARNAAAAAFETNSRLEASLKAHAEILDEMLLPQGAHAEEAYAVPDILAAKVREKEEMIRGKRLAAEGMLAGKADAATKAAAEETLRTAKQKIEETREKIVSAVTRGGASAERVAEPNAASLPVQMTAVQAIENAVLAGEEKFAAGDAGGAYVLFGEAIREAERAKQLSEAEKKFGISISAPQAFTAPPSDRTDMPFPAELPAGAGDELVAAPPTVPVPKPSSDQVLDAEQIARFKLMAKEAFCADTSNRFFLITDPAKRQFVFWDRRGDECADARYAYTLFRAAGGEELCVEHDSIAGRISACADKTAEPFFQTIIRNLDKKDFGLGAGYRAEILIP